MNLDFLKTDGKRQRDAINRLLATPDGKLFFTWFIKATGYNKAVDPSGAAAAFYLGKMSVMRDLMLFITSSEQEISDMIELSKENINRQRKLAEVMQQVKDATIE